MARDSRHLLNPLAPLDTLTPSAQDGVPDLLERDLRAYGAMLIQQAGIMLEAPQVVMATAQVLFQRFWFVTSLKHFGIRDIGLGALFLSSKLEESPIRLRDLINAYDYLLALSAHCSTLPYPSPSTFVYTPMEYFSTSFYDTKDALVVAEMQILKRLGFQAQVASPYGVLVNYLRVLELAAREDVVKKCWGYVNDLLQTPFPALYPHTTLACAAIYLTCRTLSPQLALPIKPVPWWAHFDATEEEILVVAKGLLALYKDWGSGENVWKKGGMLPVDKSGVRKLIDRAVMQGREGDSER